VEFRSSAFPAMESEGQLLNPGRWGKRLADFLFAALSELGFLVANPEPEDWGWILCLRDSDCRVWIGCGNYEEYENGFLVFVVLRRLFRRSNEADRQLVDRVVRSLDEVLGSHPEIGGIVWWERGFI